MIKTYFFNYHYMLYVISIRFDETEIVLLTELTAMFDPHISVHCTTRIK